MLRPNDGAATPAGPRVRNKHLWLWSILPLAVWLWLCFPLLAGWQVIGFRDAPNWYQPAWEWVDQQPWRQDVAPWNPWDGAGAPVAADPTIALFYPPRWLMRLPAGTHLWRFNVFLALHVLMACATAGLLARRLGCIPAGCAVAAMSYGLGGTVLFQVTNPIYLVGAAWLPLALAGGWSLSRIEADRREWSRGLLLASAALAMMVLGGDVQLAYLGLLIAGATCWWNWWQAKRDRRKSRRASRSRPVMGHAGASLLMATVTPAPRPSPGAAGREGQEYGGAVPARLLWTPVALGLAVGLLSLAQIWPSEEFAGFSQRFAEAHPQSVYDVAGTLFRDGWAAAGRDAAALLADPPPGTHAEQVYQFSQAPWSVAEVVIPCLAGQPWPVNSRWLDGLPGADRMWNVSLYQGGLILLLAVGAVFALRDTRIRWLLWIGLFGLFGSMGWFGFGWLARELGAALGTPDLPDGLGRPTGGLYWWLVALLPGMSGFRYPAKLFVLTALSLAILGGRGIDGLVAPAGWRRLRLVSVGTGICCLAVLAAQVETRLVNTAQEVSRSTSELEVLYGPVKWPLALQELQAGLRWTGSLLLVFGMCGFLNPASRWWFPLLCVFIVAADLAWWQPKVLPYVLITRVPAPTQALASNTGPSAESSQRVARLLTAVPPANWSRRHDNGRLRAVSGWYSIQLLPRHHWLVHRVRLDGPLALQPAPNRLPELLFVPLSQGMESSRHSGEGRPLPASAWNLPDFRPVVAAGEAECEVPRAFVIPATEGKHISGGRAIKRPADHPALSNPAEGRSIKGLPTVASEDSSSLPTIVPTGQLGQMSIIVQLERPGTLHFPEGWCGGWYWRFVSTSESGGPSFPAAAWQPIDGRDWCLQLPAGTSSVELKFAPRSWLFGVPASLTGWLLWLICLARFSFLYQPAMAANNAQVDPLHSTV